VSGPRVEVEATVTRTDTGDGGEVPPVTMARARALLDQIALARRELPPANRQRLAELWSAEAQVWANLARAEDFPLGTDSGALLVRAAAQARQVAETSAQSWWRQAAGSDQCPVEAS
jgi:hypothetical protein